MTAEPTYKILKVADLIPTPDNPRTIRTDSESFRTLADSVKAEGVRIPVIVRAHPKKKGKFDLRAGARRLAAAKLAKLKVIPALVYKDMSDEAAFDITFLENFAREDLTVLEEAQAVAMLLEKSGGDVKAVADKFDKSEKWIRLRANVHGNLSDKWLECIAKIGDAKADYNDRWLANTIAHFGIGHYALIARFDKDTQDRIMEETRFEDITVDELAKKCNELLMDLSTAMWDSSDLLEVGNPKALSPDTEVLKMTDKVYLRACGDCHRRTGYQPLLWDDDPKKGAVDRCLDRPCWKEHVAAALDKKLATAKEKHENLKLLTTEYGDSENQKIAERLNSDLLESSDVQMATKKDKGAFPCFVVRGKQEGKVVWKKKTAGGSISHSSGRVKGPKPLKARRKILASKRWRLILKVTQGVVENSPLDSIQHEDKLLAVMALVTRVGIDTDNNQDLWNEFTEMMAKGRDHVLADIWIGVREYLAGSITYHGGNTQLHDSYIDNARHIIKLLGLNEDKYWADACAQIPEPGTWAKLNEDGTPKVVKKLKVKAKVKKAKK